MEERASRDPFVSVVIATRNRARVLGDCIASLMAQDYPADGYEVIVVDDASEDETQATVAKIAARSTPAIRYLRQERRGPSTARNAGMDEARGDLMLFVDDDILAPSEWMSTFVRETMAHPEAEAFFGKVTLRLEGKPPRTCGRESIGESELDLGPRTKPLDPDRAAAGNMAVRRSAIERVGKLIEDLPVYGEETEWMHRLKAAGGQVLYVPDPWVWHRRMAADLRLRRLLSARFRRGRSWSRIAPFIARDVSVLQGLWRALRGLGHGLVRACWVGGLEAAYWFGQSYEAMLILARRQGGDHVRWVPTRAIGRVVGKLGGRS